MTLWGSAKWPHFPNAVPRCRMRLFGTQYLVNARIHNLYENNAASTVFMSTHGAWTGVCSFEILSFSPTYTKPGILKLQLLTVCAPDCVICVRPCPQENPCICVCVCMCTPPPPVSAYMSFSTLYLRQGIIWCAGLDLVASNKLLFQCCLCSGPNHTQLCGWPPASPQGEPYIWLVWVTDHSRRRYPTHGHKWCTSCHASAFCFVHFRENVSLHYIMLKKKKVAQKQLATVPVAKA